MARRAEVFDSLRGNGIGVQVHYLPVHHHLGAWSQIPGADRVPVGDALYERILSIPIHPELALADIGTVVERLRLGTVVDG
jgi:dTDP-4-amino-4,6-dideoxygalactose transaminase